MKVLIATDGSEYSKAAVSECCRYIIRPHTTEIMIVSSSYAVPVAAEPFALSAEYYVMWEDSLKNSAREFVAEAEGAIRDRFPGEDLKMRTEILSGAPDQQIVERAKKWGADLIVVGSHGRGFWGRLLGSISDSVVHNAPCSVLVVRKPVSDDTNGTERSAVQ